MKCEFAIWTNLAGLHEFEFSELHCILPLRVLNFSITYFLLFVDTYELICPHDSLIRVLPLSQCNPLHGISGSTRYYSSTRGVSWSAIRVHWTLIEQMPVNAVIFHDAFTVVLKLTNHAFLNKTYYSCLF